MVAEFFVASSLAEDRVNFLSPRFGRVRWSLARRAQVGRAHAYPPDRNFGSIRRRARHAAALAANAQYYPPCSPFPLFWPFCVAGAVVGTAAIIVTAPLRALTGAPRFGYYPPPSYYLPPPPSGYYAPAPPPNYSGPR
jgi:hypothetical protein